MQEADHLALTTFMWPRLGCVVAVGPELKYALELILKSSISLIARNRSLLYTCFVINHTIRFRAPPAVTPVVRHQSFDISTDETGIRRYHLFCEITIQHSPYRTRKRLS